MAQQLLDVERKLRVLKDALVEPRSGAATELVAQLDDAALSLRQVSTLVERQEHVEFGLRTKLQEAEAQLAERDRQAFGHKREKWDLDAKLRAALDENTRLTHDRTQLDRKYKRLWKETTNEPNSVLHKSDFGPQIVGTEDDASPPVTPTLRSGLQQQLFKAQAEVAALQKKAVSQEKAFQQLRATSEQEKSQLEAMVKRLTEDRNNWFAERLDLLRRFHSVTARLGVAGTAVGEEMPSEVLLQAVGVGNPQAASEDNAAVTYDHDASQNGKIVELLRAQVMDLKGALAAKESQFQESAQNNSVEGAETRARASQPANEQLLLVQNELIEQRIKNEQLDSKLTEVTHKLADREEEMSTLLAHKEQEMYQILQDKGAVERELAVRERDLLQLKYQHNSRRKDSLESSSRSSEHEAVHRSQLLNSGSQLEREMSHLNGSPTNRSRSGSQPGSPTLADYRREQELVINAMRGRLGFHENRPVAALLLFRCLLKWQSIQAQRTSIFDSIVGLIDLRLQSGQDDNDSLAYWLTTTSTLLYLLKSNTRRASGLARGASALPTDVLQPQENSRTVEARYPALLFMQQLESLVQKLFTIIRDNIKRQLHPILTQCSAVPATTRNEHLLREGESFQWTFRPEPLGSQSGSEISNVIVVADDSETAQWQFMMNRMDDVLLTMRRNEVPAVFVGALLSQILGYINATLFNLLLLRRDCCSYTNGAFLRKCLRSLREWTTSCGEFYEGNLQEGGGDAVTELQLLRQTVGFLLSPYKSAIQVSQLRHDMCPSLSLQQLYRLGTLYWDDQYCTGSLADAVLKEMKALIAGGGSTNHARVPDSTFLLDDNLLTPFSPQKLILDMDSTGMYTPLPIPESLKQHGSMFSFLQ